MRVSLNSATAFLPAPMRAPACQIRSDRLPRMDDGKAPDHTCVWHEPAGVQDLDSRILKPVEGEERAISMRPCRRQPAILILIGGAPLC
jgi:hypothetical protein